MIGLYSEQILRMLESAINYENILSKSGAFSDDYDKLQAICTYMENIITEVKELPDNRVKGTVYSASGKTDSYTSLGK